MQALLDFFASFGDTIIALVQFVWGFVEDCFSLVGYLVYVCLHIPTFLGLMPSFLQSLLVSGLAIAVLFKILGREG